MWENAAPITSRGSWGRGVLHSQATWCLRASAQVQLRCEDVWCGWMGAETEVGNQSMGRKMGSAFTQSAPTISNELFKRYIFIFIKERGCDGGSERGQGDGVSMANTSSDRTLLPLGISLRGRGCLRKWVCSQFGNRSTSCGFGTKVWAQMICEFLVITTSVALPCS